jgi:hypothetical protein
MVKSAFSPISSLDAGSKQRLNSFCSNLRTDYDNRNFDYQLRDLFYCFVKDSWRGEANRTENYLYNLKSSQDGKLFSQGVKEYSKLLCAGKAFAEPNHTYFGWNMNYRAAKREVMKEFSRLTLSPLRYYSDDDIAEAIPKKDTHAGFSYILTGKRKKGELLEGIYSKWGKFIDDSLNRGSFAMPILPAVRTQGSGNAFDDKGNFTGDCKHKTRLVSMIDINVIIAELIFAKPIQHYMAGVSWYAGGKDLDHGISGIISDMRAKHNFWTSLDYSSFDSSVSAWLIHDAFDIIREAFVGLTLKELAILQIVENDFIEKDFIFADEVIHSVKGVPSGSMFTQIVDSIVNRLVITTYLKAKRMNGSMIVMGDDNLVYTFDEIDPIDLSTYISKNFGMKVNPDKTCHGASYQNPMFLSTEWRLSGRWRDPHIVLSKLLYPERRRIYSYDATPDECLFSYVLAYNATMYQILDMRKFFEAFPKYRKTTLSRVGSHYLPGHLRYLLQYGGGYWSNLREVG